MTGFGHHIVIVGCIYSNGRKLRTNFEFVRVGKTGITRK